MNINETHDWVWEYGIRYANGKVSLMGPQGNGQHRAEGAVYEVNRKAREIGAPETARVVRRKMRRVVHRTRWEAA